MIMIKKLPILHIEIQMKQEIELQENTSDMLIQNRNAEFRHSHSSDYKQLGIIRL